MLALKERASRIGLEGWGGQGDQWALFNNHGTDEDMADTTPQSASTWNPFQLMLLQLLIVELL